jgi:hypothetical protein
MAKAPQQIGYDAWMKELTKEPPKQTSTWTEEMFKFVIEAHKRGYKANQIGAILGKSEEAVSKIRCKLRKAGRL